MVQRYELTLLQSRILHRHTEEVRIQQNESSPPGIMFSRNNLSQLNELVPLGPKLLLDLRLKLIKFALRLPSFSDFVLESLGKRGGNVVHARFFGECLEERGSATSVDAILGLLPVSEPPPTL